jgi:hypothetical protein
MKRSFGILLITTVMVVSAVMTTNVKAQSLTFSQVLLVGSTPQTVPTGKVWKIESYLLNNSNIMVNGASTNCGGTTATSCFYLTAPGGSSTAFYLKPVNASVNPTSQAGYGVTFPVWLPAGSVLATNCTSWYLSVIEFNIVP